MGLIDHQHGVESPGQRGKIRQRRKVAVHREKRIGDDQAAAKVLRRYAATSCRSVTCRECSIDLNCRPAQPAAVDDAGVVQLIAVDGVSFADQGGDRADVGGIAGGKEQRGFGRLRIRPASVPAGRADRTAAGDERAGRAPQPYSSMPLSTAAADSRIGGQAEIVVGAEIDERLAADFDPVAALRAMRVRPACGAGRGDRGRPGRRRASREDRTWSLS